MKFKRVWAISDVHGNHDLLKSLIENSIRFDPRTDLLILLGDYIDRSDESKEVVSYLSELRKANPDNVVLLMGNHEEMAFKYFTLGKNPTETELLEANMWLANGGTETIKSFGSEQEAKRVLMPFIQSLLPFYETDTHIFVHGGIRHDCSDITTDLSEILWYRPDHCAPYNGKVQIVGHTICQDVCQIGSVCFIDTGAFYHGKLSALEVNSGQVLCVKKKVPNRLSLLFEGV